MEFLLLPFAALTSLAVAAIAAIYGPLLARQELRQRRGRTWRRNRA